MRSVLVVERQEPPQFLVGCADAVVVSQSHLFILDGPPEPFYKHIKHIVPPAVCAVHTDLDAMVFQEPHELLAGELTALADGEDVPTAIAGQGLLDRLDTEVGHQPVGPPPG